MPSVTTDDPNSAASKMENTSKNVGDVMRQVLDEAQKVIGFPHNRANDAKDSGGTGSATKLTYCFYTTVNVRLQTDWEIIHGLKLEEVELAISVDGAGGSGDAGHHYGFAVRLSARCTIADVLFVVTGEIPDARKGANTDFIITITVATTQKLITPHALVAQLSSSPDRSGLDFDKSIQESSIPSNITDRLTQNGISGFTATAQITIRRTTAGTYYLRQLSFGIHGRFIWSPVSGLQISQASLGVQVRRNKLESEWVWEVIVSGTLTIEECPVVAKARFTKAGGSLKEFVVHIEAAPFVGVTPKDAMNVIISPKSHAGGDAAAGKVADSLPPELSNYRNQLDGLSAVIVAEIMIKKLSDADTWKIQYARVYAGFPTLNWKPIEEIELRALHLVMSAEKPLITTASSQNPEWSYSGWLKASVILCQSLKFDAMILHAPEPKASPTDASQKLTHIIIEIPDQITIPLDSFANDCSLVGPIKTDLSKVATENPGPSSAPIKLDAVSARPSSGMKRGLMVFIKEKTLKRIVFRAVTSEVWKITDQFQVTKLGIYFDVTDPREAELRRIAGYIYGEVQLGTSVTLFAFAAGVKERKEGAYWIRFSARYDPHAPLAVEAGSVITDPKFGSLEVQSDGWALPEFPANVSTALASLDVTLLAMFLTKPDHVDSTKTNTSLEKLQIRATADGHWKLWSGLSVADAGLDVVAERLESPKLVNGKGRQYAIFVDLHGSLIIGKQEETRYFVYFLARFEHGKSELSTFAIDISVKTLGSDGAPTGAVSASTIASLNVFGSNQVTDNDKIINDKIPDGFPISAKHFVSNDSNFRAFATLSKEADSSWKLDILTFELLQTDAWDLTEKLKIVDCAAKLDIKNPLDTDKSKRVYCFSLTSTFQLGKLRLAKVDISVIRDGSYNGLALFKVQSGPVSKILEELVGGGELKDIVPSGCPINIDDTSAGFFIFIYAGKGSDSKWAIRHTTLKFKPVAGVSSWEICSGFVIREVSLEATFLDINTDNMQKSIHIYGKVIFGQTPVEASIEITNTKITVHIRVAKASATDILGTLVEGGLKNPTLEAPALPEDAGLGNYKDSGATAEIVFTRTETGSYKAEYAAITVSTAPDFRWTLVDGTLIMNKVYAQLRITNPSSPKRKFEVTVYGHLFDPSNHSRLRDPPGLDMTLRATKEEMVIDISTSVQGCNFIDVIYVATGGVWNLSAIDMFPKFVKLILKLRWAGAKKEGSFTGVCEDWSVKHIAPSLLSVEKPRLTLMVRKALFKTRPMGLIEGECVIMGARIPVSYELPSGPLRIFGIDVKKVMEMVQRLRKLFDDAMKIGRIIADIAGTTAEVAAALEAALLAVGYAAAVVAGVLAAVFGAAAGGGGSRPSGSTGGNNKDPKTDSRGSKSKWVVGGSGISNGLPGQHVILNIYPRNAQNQVLYIDVTRLTVSIVQGTLKPGAQSTRLVIDQFESLEKGDGYKTSYTRPGLLGPYSVDVEYDWGTDPVRLSYDVMVTAEESTVSTKSFLRVPDSVQVGIPTTALIFPIDNFGNPRLGYDDHAAFNVTFIPELPEKYSLTIYNDCFAINFKLPPDSAGKEYTMEVKLGNESIQGAPAVLSATLGVDLGRCEAMGAGLSSGIGSEQTSFVVKLKDQLGNPISESEMNSVKCEAYLLINALDGSPPMEETSYSLSSLPDSTQSFLNFTYTRPPIGVKYIITISLNESNIPNSPFYLESVSTAPTLSVSNSMLLLPNPKVFAGSSFQVLIEAYDSTNQRRTFGGEAEKFHLALLVGGEVFHEIPDSPNDNGDGIYAWTITAPDELMGQENIMVSVISAFGEEGKKESAFGSPARLTILERPKLSGIHCYGPGLGSGIAEETTTFYIALLDQYNEPMKPTSKVMPCLVTILHDSSTLSSVLQGECYSVSYRRPVKPEAFNIIRVSLAGVEYPESPFVVYNTLTAPSTAPENCVIEFPTRRLGIKTEHTAIVYTVDQFKHRRFVGGDVLKVLCDGAEFGAAIDHKDGTYTVTFIPRKEDYKVWVRLEGMLLTGSPWKLKVGSARARVVLAGPGLIKAELGTETSFSVTSDPVTAEGLEGSGYAVLYPQEQIDSTAAAAMQLLPFTFPPSASSFESSYLLPYDTAGVSPGLYSLKTFWNFTASKYSRVINPINTVEVTSQPIFDVEGLDMDWYGPSSPPGLPHHLWNTFQLISDPPIADLCPDDITINAEYALSRMPYCRELHTIPALEFKKLNTPTTPGRIIVNWRALSGGLEYLLNFSYKGKPIVPLSGDDSWRLVIDDSANSLTIWRLGYPQSVDPAKGCYIYRGSGLRVVEDDGTRLDDTDDVCGEPGRMVFIKKPHWKGRNQWAGVRWPMLTPIQVSSDPGDAFLFHYRIKWTKWVDAGEVKLHAPVDLRANEGKVALLRYTASNNSAVWTVHDGHRPPSKRFDDREKSEVLDQAWKDVLYVYTAKELVIYENGRRVLQESRENVVINAVNIRMHSLDAAGHVVVEVKAVKSCPMMFKYLERPEHRSLDSWNEIVLNRYNRPDHGRPFFAIEDANAGGLKAELIGDSLKITFESETEQESSLNVTALYSTWGVDYHLPPQPITLSPHSIIQYCFAIFSCDSTCHIFLCGGAIALEITQKEVCWGTSFSTPQPYPSKHLWPYKNFVDVTCLVAPGRRVVWENGEVVMEANEEEEEKREIRPDFRVVCPAGEGQGVDFRMAAIRVMVGADLNDQAEPKWWRDKNGPRGDGDSTG